MPRLLGAAGQIGFTRLVRGAGRGLWSRTVTVSAPCRFAVPRQSAAVSPPPMMITCLPAASMSGCAMSPACTRLPCGRYVMA